MANYTAKILNNATRSLSAEQAIIANTSNNISNVNTPGYSKRTVHLESVADRSSSAGNLSIGNGVEVSNVTRIADSYISQLLQDATSKQSSSNTQNTFLGRIEQLFGISDKTTSISSTMGAFYNSLNDLTLDPSSVQARQVVISKAQELVTSINGTYGTLSAMQTEVDNRLVSEVSQVNSLLGQIADCNKNITSIEKTGTSAEASDDRDKRDQILNDLAKKISFKTVENKDGSTNVYLSNGFTLVSGTNSYSLSTTTNPSFANGVTPPSLSGSRMHYVTYDYSGGAGTSDYDLTQVLQQGDGTVGGLLKLGGYNDVNNTSAFQSDGTIVEYASRVEAIARDLLTRFNTTNLGNDENSSVTGFQPNALDLNGNTPPVYGFFDFNYSGAKDLNNNGLPDDLNSFSGTLDNFASILKVRSTDPKEIAAARDQNPANGALALVPGNGDNVQALVALRNASTTFSTGNYSFTGTADEAYNDTVTYVSTSKSSMANKVSLDQSSLTTVQNQRDQMSGVSLDEEFSNLITYQRAYQASAKMIKVADDLITQVIGLL